MAYWNERAHRAQTERFEGYLARMNAGKTDEIEIKAPGLGSWTYSRGEVERAIAKVATRPTGGN